MAANAPSAADIYKKTCSEETNGCGSWKYENVLFRCLMVKKHVIRDLVVLYLLVLSRLFKLHVLNSHFSSAAPEETANRTNPIALGSWHYFYRS